MGGGELEEVISGVDAVIVNELNVLMGSITMSLLGTRHWWW
jgi:hypothetical protein